MLISGGTAVSAAGMAAVDILVNNDKIVDLIPRGETPTQCPDGHQQIDASGLWVLPGGVDAHTHFGMPLGDGISSLSWRKSSEVALLGGTTTIIDFANPEPGESLLTAVARWQERSTSECLCDYGLHVTVTDTSADRLAEIPELVAAGLPTFKGFLAYKNRLMLSGEQMRQLMVVVQKSGGMLLVHAEDGEINAAAEQVLLNAGRIGPNWHPLAHPAESEIKAIKEVLDYALETDCPLQIVHISLAESARLLLQARKKQQTLGKNSPLLGEVCLHHLFATDQLYNAGHEAALAAVLSPPLRTATDGRELLTALVDGDLDLLSTDHCEFELATKAAAAAGGFHLIPNGGTGVGERLTISHGSAVAAGKMSPERWIEVCCEKPAHLMGLTGSKGCLAPGYDADIVLFDPTREYRWSPLGQSNHSGSFWAGLPTKGLVRDVFLRGRQVVSNCRLVIDQPGGKFLTRKL